MAERTTPRRRAAGHRLATLGADGTTMSGDIRVSDLRWLRKFLARVLERAERAHPHDRVSLRITTTELERAQRLTALLGWHDQHERLARAATVSRGTQPQP